VKKFWSLIVGVAVGAAVSLCAGFIQSDRTTFDGRTVYYGVPLAVAIIIGVVLWLNRNFQSRLPGVGMLLAWIAVTWQFAGETSSGDIGLAPSDNSSVYLVVCALSLGIAVAAPVLKPLRSESFEQTHQQLMHGNYSE
jgi:hypothetical protein